MAFKPLSYLGRAFGFLWRAVDTSRRAVVNVIFLVLVGFVLFAMFGGGSKALADKTALVLDLKGQLVEQHTSDAREALLSGVRGDVHRTVQLRDVLTVLDAAAKDSHITSVVLLLDDMDASGLASLHDVGAAIDRVKAAGKHVVAWSGSYNQRQYLLAAHADEVYMHPMGMVYLEGFGHYRNYYHDALDKIGVTVNLMRVGTYKSFAEPYIANGPSPAASEAESYLLGELWASYTGEVEKLRKLPAGAVAQMIEELPARAAAVNGDLAKLALSAKLVDGLKTRDEMRQLMIKRGAHDTSIHSFRQVAFDDYLARQHPKLFGDGIAVIVAEGEIGDGNAAPGAIGGMSTAALIREARDDDHVKAVVLRVNSPGGSPYGSELIRRELDLTRTAGKPVIVSMGDVAASGGYWITMAADEVIADPSTITGSIGVFAILPRADKVIDKLGVHVAGTTTTWLADAANPLRPLDPRFGQLIQGSINHVYDDFTAKAAQARKTTPQKIDEVAQGRVWTGTQAKQRGLVDKIGGYREALADAAARANLGADYRVSYIERESTRLDRVLEFFGMSAAESLGLQVKLGLATTGLPPKAAADMVKDMSFLSELSDGHKPFMAVTHCLCSQP